jgi:heme o synthase
MPAIASFNTYYQLTKPGIIYGNLLTTSAGFFLGSKGHAKLGLFVATLFGTAMVIAAGCVYNNYLDRHIDKQMKRTKKRALVSGEISPRQALLFATVLGIIGFLALALWSNALTVLIGMVGLVSYVAVYGFWKRRSDYGTLVGSIAGATPIVAGYCSASGRFDLAAALLALILAAWQMPHFYAIAMYRSKEYKAAGIPVLPLMRGNKITKIQIVLYTALFLVANTSLTLFGYTGYIYLVIMSLLGMAWLYVGVSGFKAADDNVWARKMFLFSLIIILCTSMMISVGGIIP